MSEDYLRDKLYNIEMQVKFVMSIKEELVISSDQRSSVINMPVITVILFTGRLPCVQCTKNRLTCENYTANYKFFQEHQLNSKRFPGVVDPSLYRLTLTQLKQISYITVLVTHL